MRNGKDRMAAIRSNLEALIGEAAAGNPEAQARLDDLSRDRRFALIIDSIFADVENTLKAATTDIEKRGGAADLASEKQNSGNDPRVSQEPILEAASKRWGHQWGVSLFRKHRGAPPDTYLWKSPQHAPSGVRYTLAMHGEDGVWAAMRVGETPLQFKARVAAGHSAAAYCEDFWDSQRRLAHIKAVKDGRAS